VAYRDAIQQSLTENPQELAPYRYMAPAKEAVTEVVSEKIELFKSV
jgi:fructose/tagatose bisphosphate aldolase